VLLNTVSGIIFCLNGIYAFLGGSKGPQPGLFGVLEQYM
jgi:hypothetical protein